MLACIKSQVVIGIDSHYVDVEVDIAGGLPNFSVVGLPDVSVKESRDRVRAAIKNSGFSFPSKRVVVNLAPANIKKDGPSFDLPIALAVLVASGHLTQEEVGGKSFCGELSLDGSIRPVRGVLAMAAALSQPKALGFAARRANPSAAGKNGIKELVVPYENFAEAAVVKDIKVYPLKTLSQLYDFLKSREEFSGLDFESRAILSENDSGLDFADVKGQAYAKRGLEIAAAGGHNVLMIGPPGSGKTMLAKRLMTILPPMEFEQMLQTAKVHSIAGFFNASEQLSVKRPFRAPHHTISYAGLVGGGANPRPGEISLAHNGLLFLDELPEFRRDALEALRQPLEDGTVAITRAEGNFVYPSKFIFIAAMNPCPCGYFTDPKRECFCTPQQIQRYLSKISGPLIDRIDIHLQVPALKYEEISSKSAAAESSLKIKQRVVNARGIQKGRYSKKQSSVQRPDESCNAYLSGKAIERFCRLDTKATVLLKTVVLNKGLTARAYHKVLKVARTIADLADSEIIKLEHISEAVQYLPIGRMVM